jgi:protein-disulfide isomerase
MIVAVCGAMLVAIVHGTWILPPPAPTRAAHSDPIRPEPALPTDPVSLDGAQVKGLKTAPVAVIEYSDFQCPYCGRFARDTFPAIDKAYIAVLFAFRQFPLESIHPHALPAAEAAECAATQGQFWKRHDLTFADQSHLDDAAIEARAKSGGLDGRQFHTCLADAGTSVLPRIKADEQSGAALAVSVRGDLHG